MRPLCAVPRVSDVTPRERRELDPGTCCPDCGGDLRVTPKACDPMRTFGATGEDVSELLDMIAAQMKVIWSCHGYVPVSQLIYAAFRSNAKGLLPPSDEWR
jgi:transposase